MRVLRVSHSAVARPWRGRERALRRAGLDVRLLCAAAWDVGGSRVRLGTTDDDGGVDVRPVRTLGRHPALFVYDPRPLWRALGEPWDVLDVHEEPFALATAEILLLRRWRELLDRLRGGRARAPAPYVLYSAQNIPKRYPWPFRVLERRALRGAAGVCVCHDGARHVLRGKGARCPIETVPLGIDPADFSARGPADARRPGGPLRVTYAGRLEPHKGVDVAVAAVAGDPAMTLTIAGAGSAEADLRALAAGAGGRVRFVGPLDPPALAELYRSSDAVVVPSRATAGWVEQFGRVAVEAMACGAPVVAAATGALPDVVGGAGLLVPPDDAPALHAALRRVGTEPGLAARLRADGLARAATCTWDAVARRYLDLYATALSSAGPAEIPSPVPAEVLVVAYGAPELVRQALEPLVGTHPLTVVDNSSLAAVREVAESCGARYVDPGRNAGFAAGVNHGLALRRDLDADLLLLNPDAVVGPDAVARLADALRNAPDVASAGPAQVDAAGTPARVAWPFPSPARAWLEACGLGRVLGPGGRGTFVVGSVLLLSARALREVGPFDERFFLYAEETDWAYRASLAGWRHAVVPEARALHLGGATSTDPVRRETVFHASQETYLRKHFGAVGWAGARAAQVVGSAVRGVVLPPERARAARRRLGLYLRGPVAAARRLPQAPAPSAVRATA